MVANRLNLRQIEAFRAVMTTGQMTTAAELLFVTQPAISRLIADLQHATGLRLFDRHGNRIEPTPAAYALMSEVERAFVGLDRIARVAADIARNSAGSLRIVAMPALANGVLARYAAQFLRGRGGLRLSLDGLPSAVVIERLVAGHADIGYADGPVTIAGLTCRPHYDAAVLALPPGHRLSGSDRITPADLAGERMITIEQGAVFSKRVDVVLAGVPVIRDIAVQLSHSACSMVLEGAGLALIDGYSAREFTARGLVIRPFHPALDAGFTELVRPAQADQPLLRAFVDGFAGFLAQTARDRG